MSPVTWICSPRRAVDGDVSRSTRTSSAPARPVRWVSTWIPRAAASAASVWPEPVVSLPSERSTIRFWASSGNSAPARRSAAPMSVAPRTGVEAMRSISASSDGSRSTSASPPNATIPATSSSRLAARLSRRNARASSRPAVPTESDRSTTYTTASRSTGSTSWNPASANTSADSSSDPDREGRPAPAHAQPPPRREVQRDHDRQQRRQQQQGERGVEADAHQAPLPAGPRPPRNRPADGAPEARERVALVDEPLQGEHEQGDQHDRDPQLVAGVGPRLARRTRRRAAGARRPGRPRPRGPAASPGAIRDSSTSSRSTANRTGAPGSAGRNVGDAPGERRRRRRRSGRGSRRAAADRGGGSPRHRRSGSRCRRPAGRSARTSPSAAPAGGATSSSVVPSGPLDADARGPGRDGERDRARRARWRPSGVSEPPSSSPGEVGEEHRERDLERQVGPARLEGHDRGRAARPACPRRAAARCPGPGMTGRAQAGSSSFWASPMWVVERST